MVDDEDLLASIYRSCQDLRDAAWEKSLVGFATDLPDDPRWQTPFPLRPELHLRYLYLQALDALEVSTLGLRVRTSSAALGALRLLAECCVLVKWLTEKDGAERRKRSYRLAMDGIKGTKRMQKYAKGGVSPQALAAMEKQLRELAKEDGVQHVGCSPDSIWLFNKYLQSGYASYSILSELGSHAGFFHVTLFRRDPKSKTVAVDFGGAHAERALWIGQAFELAGYTVDEVGRAFGWDDWLQSDVMPIVRRAKPLMNPIHAGWSSRWGIEPPEDA